MRPRDRSARNGATTPRAVPPAGNQTAAWLAAHRVSPPEFESLRAVDAHLATRQRLAGAVFQSLDLTQRTEALVSQSLRGAIFLGCAMAPEALDHALHSGALVFGAPPELPYRPYRNALYTVDELYAGFDPGRHGTYADTLDARVYAHYLATGGPRPGVDESLFRRLHDHGITDALEEELGGRTAIGIMGGHSLRRDTAAYRDVAVLARALARAGRSTLSGGGPGAMEATHLGAHLAAWPDAALDEAIALLAPAPLYKPAHEWLATAFAVRARFPARPLETGLPAQSVGIPTWCYGHEPPNAFASQIGKYFMNSEREDGLLAIATGGVVFAPGSLGTVQEIFQDAAQNHYETAGYASPMVLLGRDYWNRERPLWNLLHKLAEGRPWAQHIHLVDTPDEAVAVLLAFTPPLVAD
ncbi:MAG: hypothetical protein NDJ94_20480 [Vicinamibacteria bacterium]|nr:hypothetical protein [Vicinamibacteria bacterium]